MFDLWMTPWRTGLAMTSASLETYLAFQKGLMKLSAITLADGFDGQDEAHMREAFQMAADANVRRWADTADIVQGLPGWYHDALNAPGSALTDIFDRLRRSARPV